MSEVSPPQFGIRLRFLTSKGLTGKEKELVFDRAGVKVTLKSAEEKCLSESGWLVLRALGFETEKDAKDYGQKLSLALQIASMRRWWGVDIGQDKATSALFRGVTDSLEAEGHHVRSNIHGLDVFPDRANTSWFTINGTATVSSSPTPIIEDLGSLAVGNHEVPQDILDALRIWNEALISKEPAAQAVLAISAVEMLAQEEKWSIEQKLAIQIIEESVRSQDGISLDEREEILDALKRMHRFGINQGFRRLFAKLGLTDLWKPWSEVYSKRSQFLHGIVYSNRGDQSVMVHPALSMSGRIIITALSEHVPNIANDLDTIMPLPTPSHS